MKHAIFNRVLSSSACSRSLLYCWASACKAENVFCDYTWSFVRNDNTFPEVAESYRKFNVTLPWQMYFTSIINLQTSNVNNPEAGSFRALTSKSSGETDACPSEAASSLPRVGRRWCPGFSKASARLSQAFSNKFSWKDFRACCASDEKYACSTVSKYSICRHITQKIGY